MAGFSYIPLINEPCMFTGVRFRLNRDWVFFVKRLAAGIAVNKGQEKFNESVKAFEEFFSPTILGFNQDKSPRSQRNLQHQRDMALFVNNMELVKSGMNVMHNIHQELKDDLDEDGFAQPTSILTMDKLISMRWVMHTARVDRMLPEEAYVLAQALTKS